MNKFENLNLINLLENELKNIDVIPQEEVGTVLKIYDGIVEVFGLKNVLFGEVVKFDSGNTGQVLKIETNVVFVAIFERNFQVKESDVVRRTHDVLRVGVTDDFLGRVISPLGHPVDGLGDFNYQQYVGIEAIPPALASRRAVDQMLFTGNLTVDALMPVGKGQRALLVGDRGTGKTAMLIDIFLNQKGRDVICIYVSIGNKQATTASLIETLRKHGAMEYTVIVQADAAESALSQYVSPYAGCAIAEYFMKQGKDVLIAYDDLTNHAVAYRQLSLLLKRAPGREAYPGDIFYIHAKLLERSCPLIDSGSMTALPVVTTQANDMTSFVPTNLVSITDGQIVFDTDLFNMGIRPAVKIGLSVSRVGNAVQVQPIKRLAKSLKLILARYDELQAFARFGSDLDSSSLKILSRGDRVQELIRQSSFERFSLFEEVVILFLFGLDSLDLIPVNQCRNFARRFTSYMAEVYPQIRNQIENEQNLDDKLEAQMTSIFNEFMEMNS